MTGSLGNLPKLITRKQAAATLGCSTKHLENLERDGEGPPVTRLSERMVRYDLEAFHAWLAENTRRPGAGR